MLFIACLFCYQALTLKQHHSKLFPLKNVGYFIRFLPWRCLQERVQISSIQNTENQKIMTQRNIIEHDKFLACNYQQFTLNPRLQDMILHQVAIVGRGSWERGVKFLTVVSKPRILELLFFWKVYILMLKVVFRASHSLINSLKILKILH